MPKTSNSNDENSSESFESENNGNGIAPSLDTLIHLIAGGAGGTAGAILTCPLEVVKTRLQSSNSGFSSDTPRLGAGAGPGGPSSEKQNFSKSNFSKSNFSADNDGFQRSRIFSTNRSLLPSKPEVPLSTNTSNAIKSQIGSCRGPSNYLSSWRQLFLWSDSIFAKSPKSLSAVSYPNDVNVSSNIRFSSSSSSAVAVRNNLPNNSNNKPLNVWQCLKYIVENEGFGGLFKGLGPNLVGVAPSRAIYFFTYSTAKKKINSSLPARNRDTPFVHVTSAASAGFCASTCTNPIWLIKTRLQLDRASGNNTLTVRRCISKINSEKGFFGFWKGVTASYWGISETMIHFVIYEFLKKELSEYQNKRKTDEKTFVDFFGFMLCGACSKTCATIVAYPHEVARTRMREVGNKYRSFWQTLAVVAREEGRAGLYRGLVTQLIRQIPNTAIMMSTYELTVHLLTNYFTPTNNEDDRLFQTRNGQGQ